MKIPAAKTKNAADLPDKPVWAVVGPEDMTRHQVVEAITARFLDPSFADFDLDTVDASALDANRLLGAWRTLPLGSPRRVVIARNLEDAQAGEIGKLAEGIKQGSQKGCLILDSASETGREMNALVKAADAAGVVVNCQSPKPDDARVFLTETATAKGVKYEAAAAAELVRRIGPDLWMLSTETEKLANHVWPETVIRKADVERLSPASPEDRIFAMIDAVCEGRQGAADSMLRDVFLAGDDIRGTAHRTLAVLARHFRLLWQARVLRDSGFTFRNPVDIPADAADLMLDSPNLPDVLKRQTFLAGKYRSQSERFSIARLARAFEVLAETDLALKGRAASVGDPQADMEMCLWRLGALARTAKRPGG